MHMHMHLHGLGSAPVCLVARLVYLGGGATLQVGAAGRRRHRHGATGAGGRRAWHMRMHCTHLLPPPGAGRYICACAIYVGARSLAAGHAMAGGTPWEAARGSRYPGLIVRTRRYAHRCLPACRPAVRPRAMAAGRPLGITSMPAPPRRLGPRYPIPNARHPTPTTLHPPPTTSYPHQKLPSSLPASRKS